MNTEQKGHLHPITQFVREVASIFAEMGFTVAEGPELESEYYNFDALNIPKDHPSEYSKRQSYSIRFRTCH